MRKIHQLAVLSLFLLVPASIICAQTAYLTGTVTMEQDYRTVNYSSPNGNVKVFLPGDLSAPGQGTVTISGTVRTEPAGKSEKEKANNLKALQKMALNIGANSISVLAGQHQFTISMPGNLMTPVPIDMVDPGGNRATVMLKNPILSAPPTTGTLPPGQASMSTDQKVFITNGNIPVYAANNTSTLFQPSDKFFIKDATGTMTEAVKVAQSPTQTVLSSQGIQPGATTIVRESVNRTDEVKVRMADLNLSSPNTNLRRGQTSSLTVTIDPKITDKDSAEAMQIPIMSLDIKNLTPGVVEMSGGNIQVMSFPTTPGATSPAAWQATRTITGITPGSFNVTATLHSSPENTNPVHSQLEEIKTAEEFNKWSDAIKKDLSAYLKDLPKDDLALRKLTQRAIDQLPVANSTGELDMLRLETRYLLRDLPGFQNNQAREGMAAFQTYLFNNDRLKNAGPKTGWPLHVDIIESGLNFIQNQNRNPVNTSIQNQVTTALGKTNALQHDYSANNLGALSNELLSLNSTPFVNGLADVAAILYPKIVKTDGPVGGQMSGHDVTSDKNEARFYDDGAVIIFANGIRYIFYAVGVDGTSVKALMEHYDDPAWPAPPLVGCDSLTRICKKTQALNIFWGDVYSVFNGKMEQQLLNGVTKEKYSNSSLLITRGWEIDCCTGLFRLKLFFQSMGVGETISFTKTYGPLNQWKDPCPRPDCPVCEEKCKKDQEMREKNK